LEKLTEEAECLSVVLSSCPVFRRQTFSRRNLTDADEPVRELSSKPVGFVAVVVDVVAVVDVDEGLSG
jgi:hypothetical protein